MRRVGWLIVLMTAVAWQGVQRGASEMCLGAVHAVLHAQDMGSPERSTPPGEWCQRPQPQMSKKAHACSCHQTDCQDDDPSHVPAHTDANCLNFCTTSQCRCPMHDCP